MTNIATAHPDDAAIVHPAAHSTRLSLAMARVMIEQVDGQLWAESPGLGRGFTLHIRLPLSDMQAARS